MAKFTDNQLSKLYLQLSRDYEELVQQRLEAGAIYQELSNRVHFALNNPASSLYYGNLDIGEPNKILHVLNIFMSTRPMYQQQPVQAEERGNIFVHNFVHVTIEDERWNHYRHRHHCYCASNDTLFTWWMLNSLMAPRREVIIINTDSSSNRHSHSKDEKKGDALALLLLIAIAVMLAMLAFIALYYLLSQALNSLERMCYNEGWLQAMGTMAGALAGGYVAYMLSNVFAAAPLMSLAVAAGVSNPIGWVITGAVCLSIIGAAAGSFLADKVLQNYVLYNAGALDPWDPKRFVLTESEERALFAKGWDPMKVKCAIVALRAEMGEQGVPNLLHSRLWGSNKVQENLNLIRQLRAGDLGVENEWHGAKTTLDVGNAHFDFRLWNYYQAPVQQMYPDLHSGVHASAPPSYEQASVF